MKTCAKVCNACPFRKNAAPGWLGPHTIEEIQNNFNFEIPFTCHKQRDGKKDHMEIDVCRGWLHTANKSFKVFGSSVEYGAKLRALQNQVKEAKEEAENIMSMREFRTYHTKSE